MDVSWKHYAKWKKPVTKGHIMYDFFYMNCTEKASPQSIKWISGWLPLGVQVEEMGI